MHARVGDIVKKEPYVKPTVKSEILKAEVLNGSYGSGGCGNPGCQWPWR